MNGEGRISEGVCYQDYKKKLRIYVKEAGEFGWVGLGACMSRTAPPQNLLLKAFKLFHKILLVRDVYHGHIQDSSYQCNGNKERDLITRDISMR